MAHEIVDSVDEGALMFDIGAHTGSHAVPFIAKNVRVVLVEPQPKLVDELTSKYKENDLVTIVPKGVSSKPGSLEMSINTDEPMLSTFQDTWKTGRFKHKTWDEQISVEVTTLDLLIAEYGVPQFIKIDVEGYELEVLRGLTQKVGAISFEFIAEGLDIASECMDYLISLGYTSFNFSLGSDPEFRIEWTDKDQVIEQINLLIPEDAILAGDIYVK